MGRHAVEVPGGERDILALAGGRDVVDLRYAGLTHGGVERFLHDLGDLAAADAGAHLRENTLLLPAVGLHDDRLDRATPDVDACARVHQFTIRLAKRAAPNAPV
jgi:hypothetical protein